MSERQTELRAEEGLAISHPTPPRALPKRGHVPQSHASRCSNVSKETSLTEITAGLHFLLLGLTLTLKSSSGSRPKYSAFYSIMSIKRIINDLLKTFFCSASILLTAHLSVLKITFFYNVSKLMILTGVQGVHHVFGRDKDLVCHIKAYYQSR